MSMDQVTEAAVAAIRAGNAALDGSVDPSQPPLLGRMLNVSRLATIGEMAAGIAHELNQPLTAIANYSQACERMLSQPRPDTQALRMALGEITSQAVRASQIIGRLRTLARSHEMRREPTDVNSMVTEVAALAGADARARDVQVVLNLDPALPTVVLDPVQIQHVLLNLLRNATEAVAAVPSGERRVTIRSALTPVKELELAVCDTGPGITDDIRARVFDPFFSTKDGGTGLGLPISHSIVRAHGGALGYRHNESGGACFYIHLPLHP